MTSAFAVDSESFPKESQKFAPYSNTMPRTPLLGALANEQIHFSENDNVGGIAQVFGTGWTIAGMVGYLCGLPLHLPYLRHVVTKYYFLDNAVCVPDILNQAGFKQIRFSGVSDAFGGTGNFYQKHHVAVHDLSYFQKTGVLPKILNEKQAGTPNIIFAPGNKPIGVERWGINDRTLFALAEEEIQKLTNQSAQPFAVYLSTMDTHPPTGFVDPEMCPDLPHNLQQSFTCSERIILNFVQKIKDIPNTAIILLGDHLPVDVEFLQNQNIYNVFLNPAFVADFEKTKNRKLSHFDIAPLILESVGIPAESFGLGRNPLKGKTLLETEFSYESFNQELLRGNKMYEDFWKIHGKCTFF